MDGRTLKWVLVLPPILRLLTEGEYLVNVEMLVAQNVEFVSVKQLHWEY